MTQLRVYVAGKLNDDSVGYLDNCRKMIRTAITIQKMGFAVFVPCLDLLMGICAPFRFEYEDYAGNNMNWAEVSDIVYFLPSWKRSHGSKAEMKRAKEKGIPCVFSFKELRRTAKKLLKQKRVEKWVKPLEAKA